MIATPLPDASLAKAARSSQMTGPACTHELKSWPAFFEPTIRGLKTHDLRRSDDRVFRTGDHLRLREFDPRTESYTGRECMVEVTYVTSATAPCAYFEAALDPHFCIMSIKLLTAE